MASPQATGAGAMDAKEMPEAIAESAMEAPAEAAPDISRLAARGYLYTGEPAPWGYGAYAYVVFTSDPKSPGQKERAQALCQAFTESLPAATTSRSAGDRMAEMVTFWPLKGKDPGREPDCTALLAHYDLHFAAKVAGKVRKQGATGPLLVAWKEPVENAASDALVLDMSRFATRDLGRGLQIWKKQIAQNPKNWQRGWRVAVLKEAIRNSIENTGPGVVSVIATFLPRH